MSKGTIYFIQPAELVGTDRYKIGCSKIPDLKRCKEGYRKGSRYICIMECDNPLVLEKKIKDEFNKLYKLAAGNEFYMGDETMMKQTFLKITEDYEKSDIKYKKYKAIAQQIQDKIVVDNNIEDIMDNIKISTSDSKLDNIFIEVENKLGDTKDNINNIKINTSDNKLSSTNNNIVNKLVHYDKEYEKIQLVNNITELDKYIRIKLGQTIFPTPIFENTYEFCKKLCEKCKTVNRKIGILLCKDYKCYNYYTNWKKNGHLRFRREENSYEEINNEIIELFSDYYKDKKCITYAHKGQLYIQIIDKKNYENHDYSNHIQCFISKWGEETIYNDSCHDCNNFPYVALLEHPGGTVKIIRDIILMIYNNNYVKSEDYEIEFRNNIIKEYKRIKRIKRFRKLLKN